MELSRRGARVLIGSRNAQNGLDAVEEIKSEIPNALVSAYEIDLCEPSSIAGFSQHALNEFDQLDILLLNAGIVFHPQHTIAPTGRELHMQVNYLGHYVLMCQLGPLIIKSMAPRIVQSTTVPYEKGRIDFEDFDWANRKYDKMLAYFDSRLAQLLMRLSIKQAFAKAGINGLSMCMQPGLVKTDGLQKAEFGGRLLKMLARPLNVGCAVHLKTCADPDVSDDYFWEPKFMIRGIPVAKAIKSPADDLELAQRLSDFSQKLTGLKFSV